MDTWRTLANGEEYDNDTTNDRLNKPFPVKAELISYGPACVQPVGVTVGMGGDDHRVLSIFAVKFASVKLETDVTRYSKDSDTVIGDVSVK
jgi:hypothetical protein